MMGRTSVQLPDESDFEPAYRIGRWTSSASFQINTSRILNRHFTTGYFVYESGGISKFLTTYHSLQGMPERMHGEVAVLILHPFDIGPNEFSFHILYKARERKSHTDWRDDITQVTRKAAERFTSQLLAELKEESHAD
jgi:hypothetical protein